METKEKTLITVENTINAPVAKVWESWTKPEHITQWNHASDDWHSPSATNDLRKGGSFTARMEAKDGSVGFEPSSFIQRITKILITHQQFSISIRKQ